MEPETDGIEMEIKETTNERIFSSFDMNCMHYALCIMHSICVQIK